MLFHYHFWTPYVEETEDFYRKRGFRISQRIGKYKGEFQTFNPPLTWDDFRDKNVLFRIIEARKGNINITFGYGKRVRFDHIGFLVSQEEHDQACKNAYALQWNVEIGERRTFIAAPFGFDIELQTHADAVDNKDPGELQKLVIVTKTEGLEKNLSLLFERELETIESVAGDVVTIKQAFMKGMTTGISQDPNGVEIHAI